MKKLRMKKQKWKIGDRKNNNGFRRMQRENNP